MEADSSRDLIKRTRAFGVRVSKLVDAMPSCRSAEVVSTQLSRSAFSVGANYRAAKRGRSRAEFIAKLGIVEEEADECGHWLQVIVDLKLMPKTRIESLAREADELLAIVVASIKTARGNNQ
ncbi:four helix bundle protein [Planctomycetales bacterium ZRK34]|nr:four helix bundle protein [Planctomycetales bacterium ZRK34]